MVIRMGANIRNCNAVKVATETIDASMALHQIHAVTKSPNGLPAIRTVMTLWNSNIDKHGAVALGASVRQVDRMNTIGVVKVLPSHWHDDVVVATRNINMKAPGAIGTIGPTPRRNGKKGECFNAKPLISPPFRK